MGRISILKRPLPSSSGSGLDSDPTTSNTPSSYVQNKFQKRTAKGTVSTIVRERYLRDLIPCGSKACKKCIQNTQANNNILLSLNGLKNEKIKSDHYIVLDTNVILHQMDLLESILATSQSSTSPSPSFTDVIILQTVLEEVRHRSLPLYNRLQALLKEPERRWFVFWNAFSSQTATTRQDGESPNDLNDRSIRTAVEWYRSHLSSTTKPTSSTSTLDVVLISDDVDNVSKAKSSGLMALSVKDYVSGMKDSNRLLDLITSRSSSSTTLTNEDQKSIGGSKNVLYPEHLNSGSITAGLTSGVLHRGYFNASVHNYLEASVKVQKYDKPVLIIGRESMNRAVDGDVVSIVILPKDQWKEKGSDRVLDAEKALRNDDAGEEGEDEEDENEGGGGGLGIEEEERRIEKDSIKEDQQKERELQPTGKVLGIIKRNWRSYVSHIDQTSLSSSNSSLLGTSTVFATPLDKKIPRVRIRTSQASILVGQKILIALDDWRSTSRYPDGHFIRSLGNTLDKDTEQESLLLENDVPYRPFSKAILDCLPIEGDDWKVPPKPLGDINSNPIWRDREDLREETICSIDPPGCQDIDDALHARLLPNGNIQTGVHIADVSFFLKPDTPMDLEAASRGVTVYLVDKRIDMLPHLLGTNLCSLRPFVERLAFSCIWEMDPKTADIISVRFTKSVIASKGAFTYEEAQRRKDDKSKNDEITKSIRLLNNLAIKLKEKRMKNGALNLASPEVKIHLDSNESTGPIDVEQKELFETNSLVEEFMLLANISVARKIYETFPNTAVLRRHSPPPKTNFDLLKDILKVRKGLDLDVSSSGKLAQSLDGCIDPKSKTFNTLVRIMATRCMLPAEYFSGGSISKDSFGHYGLATEIYTHFTSPIRRFADVLTHRQLAASIEYQSLHPSLNDSNHVEEILKTVNKRHRGAQMAGRSSVEFYVGLAITKKNLDMGADADDLKVGKGSVTLKEEAFVIKTFRNGLAVFVTRYGLEGLITFKEECIFDAEKYEVTIPASASGLGKDITLGVFDKCTVEIGVEKDKSTQRGRVKMGLIL